MTINVSLKEISEKYLKQETRKKSAMDDRGNTGGEDMPLVDICPNHSTLLHDNN